MVLIGVIASGAVMLVPVQKTVNVFGIRCDTCKQLDVMMDTREAHISVFGNMHRDVSDLRIDDCHAAHVCLFLGETVLQEHIGYGVDPQCIRISKTSL